MATTLFRQKRVLFPSSSIPTVFLQLPATYRSFHASPQSRFLEAGVSTAHTIFEGVHAATGLPWVYTLPLTALAIRTTVILPLSIYARRVSQKQIALTPLINSWQHILRKETMAESGHMGPQIVQDKLLWHMRRKRSEIYKRWGCQLWKTMLPMMQLPIWLTAIEAVRAMCGTRAGMLGMIMRSENDTDAISAGIDMEASFATEGALWFPDLLVPDPHLILPFILSGTVLLNLTNARSGPNQSAWQRRLQTSFKIVALALAPLTLDIPGAMMVYWISSSMLAYIQAVVLDKMMPIPRPVKPCDPRRRLGLPVAETGGTKE